MMELPSWVEEELTRDSAGRYRIRWSVGRNRWQVEEKIGRQTPRKRRFANTDDEAIKEEQGYKLLFEVTPGDRTRCPRCAKWMKVTAATRPRTSKCQACRKEWKFCFMPSWNDLLVHLRYIQPERGGFERVLADTDHGNAEREKSNTRTMRRNTEAIWKEDFTRNFEIDSVGWGKHSGTRTWS